MTKITLNNEQCRAMRQVIARLEDIIERAQRGEDIDSIEEKLAISESMILLEMLVNKIDKAKQGGAS